MKLELTQFRKKIRDFEISADLSVGQGERLALTGPSGSGKTTLFKFLSGLDLDAEGEVILNGTVITQLQPEKRNFGVIFQEGALFTHLSVFENIEFPLKLRGVAKEIRKHEVNRMAFKLGLEKHLHSSVNLLSGGEKQRVAFARAIVFKPQVLLLDEPFSALDNEKRAILRNELLELHSLHPVPLILVTHDEADVVALATRVIRASISTDGTQRRFV